MADRPVPDDLADIVARTDVLPKPLRDFVVRAWSIALVDAEREVPSGYDPLTSNGLGTRLTTRRTHVR